MGLHCGCTLGHCGCTIGQINQKFRRNHWATLSSFPSSTCSPLLALLACATALTRSLACSLRSLLSSWDSQWLFFSVFFLCWTKLRWRLENRKYDLITHVFFSSRYEGQMHDTICTKKEKKSEIEPGTKRVCDMPVFRCAVASL